MVSPLPLARWRPSGLKPTASTASVWPARRAAQCLKTLTYALPWLVACAPGGPPADGLCTCCRQHSSHAGSPGDISECKALVQPARSAVSPCSSDSHMPTGQRNGGVLAERGRAPASDAVQRDTGRTRNTACGWYTMRSAASTDSCAQASAFSNHFQATTLDCVAAHCVIVAVIWLKSVHTRTCLGGNGKADQKGRLLAARHQLLFEAWSS